MSDVLRGKPVRLSAAHVAAVERPRRIMVNNDVGMGDPMGPGPGGEVTPEQWVAAQFSLFDEPGSQVDCVSWCVDEGNYACYPSQVLPRLIYPGLQKWLESGVDIAQLMAAECHKRGLEAFWAYRLNGADREEDVSTPARLPMKEQNPDWILKDSWWGPGLWNFAVPEVQDYKVAILREVAENYDYDGLSLDFGRHPPCLPVGEQWEHREAMTNFVTKVRVMLQEVAEKRGRPFLLAVRVAATPAGCHYDGLDIETWVRQNLVDIIIMGARSIEVDVAGFRRITAGTHVKLYPCLEDYHSTDGYRHPPIEFFRGVAANWWQQGVDGILTFNFENRGGFAPHQQAYHEIGNPETLRLKDKMFVLQRRYGYLHPWNLYQNVNAQAPLPATLPTDGLPIILTLYVADDLSGNAERIESVELHVLLSGAAAEDVVEVKLNGVLLPAPTVQADGWRVFALRAHQFAVGPNLVSVRAAAAQSPISIEKLEVHVAYTE